jgi:hypothetical protein
MGINNRYMPSHPQGQSCQYALDFSNILPFGVGLAGGALQIATNTVPPVNAPADFVVGPVSVSGRRLYANLAGGIEGKDYLLLWVAQDSLGNTWPRTCLLLCDATS